MDRKGGQFLGLMGCGRSRPSGPMAIGPWLRGKKGSVEQGLKALLRVLLRDGNNLNLILM